MHHHSIVIQRRFVGLTLLASFLLFWGGSAFSLQRSQPATGSRRTEVVTREAAGSL